MARLGITKARVTRIRETAIRVERNCGSRQAGPGRLILAGAVPRRRCSVGRPIRVERGWRARRAGPGRLALAGPTPCRRWSGRGPICVEGRWRSRRVCPRGLTLPRPTPRRRWSGRGPICVERGRWARRACPRGLALARPTSRRRCSARRAIRAKVHSGIHDGCARARRTRSKKRAAHRSPRRGIYIARAIRAGAAASEERGIAIRTRRQSTKSPGRATKRATTRLTRCG
jgi:hypothetical protein